MIRCKLSKAAAIRDLKKRGWIVVLPMPHRQSAKLQAPDGHTYYGDPRDLLDELAANAKPETLAQAIEKGRADYERVTGQTK